MTVTSYEPDGQTSYLCGKTPPDTAFAITKASDLAVTTELVFFWDNQYDQEKRCGGGLLCKRSEMLSIRDGNKSLVGFTDHQFTLVCVLSGCDYVSKEDHASGLGFARAIKTVRQHVDMESVITHLMTCGKYSVTSNTP